MSTPRPNPAVLIRAPKACACDICVSMCNRPCWPTPAEAERLLDGGYAARLMADWWSGEDDQPIYILCGANPGYEGREAAEVSIFDYFLGTAPLAHGCSFFDAESKRCVLHEGGLKPIEGRLVDHDWPGKNNELHEAVAATWDTAEGRAAVERWRRLVA
jgi:hypothetical protein